MFSLRSLLSLVFLLAGSAVAQEPPFDERPEIAPPYDRIRFDAGTEETELKFPATYTLWLPPGVRTLRGIVVHQHGCGPGSAFSGLTGAHDLHWQALARKHDCALLAASYEMQKGENCGLWCDPRNGSDARFRQALDQFAERSGHAELTSVPWTLWGHSGGGVWAAGMTLLHPGRVAAAWLRSGTVLFEGHPDAEGRVAFPLPSPDFAVPMMCNLGVDEGVSKTEGKFAKVWPYSKAFATALRKQNAPVAIAIDPLTSHECGNQRYLAIPWLDACLTARLPEAAGQPLRPMPTEGAYVAKFNGTQAIPAKFYSGDPATVGWLPDADTARLWTQYVADTQVADTTPPPAPTSVRIEDGVIRWDAAADLQSGIERFVIESDGVFVASVPKKPKNPRGRPVFQGLQYSDTPEQPLNEMQYELSEGVDASAMTIRAKNTAGLLSPPAPLAN